MANRAVSETVGFVLVFALITTTVGVVYVSGIGGLTDARNAEQLTNAERAFDVLADNMADIHRRNVPSRATEIKLGGAEMGYGETTTMEITVEDSDASPDTVKLAPLVYTSDSESKIVYEGGAVIRSNSNGGAVMKREPNMMFRGDGEVAILPVVQTRAVDSGGIGGSTTVLVRGTRALSEVLTARTDDEYTATVTVDTTASRAPAWKRYLEAEMDESGWSLNCELEGADDDTVECEFDVKRLYVTTTRIDVTIS